MFSYFLNYYYSSDKKDEETFPNVEIQQSSIQEPQEPQDELESICAICLEGFDEKNIAILPCHHTHKIHFNCLLQMTARNNYQCPYCRAEFERPNILPRESSPHDFPIFVAISPRQNNSRRVRRQNRNGLGPQDSRRNGNRNLRQSQRRILAVVNLMENISYEGIIIRIQFRYGRTYTLNTIRSNCSELIQRGNLQRIGRGGRVRRIR